MTININGIGSHTRTRMFEEFLQRHDVDIALIQEVTNGDTLAFKGYQSTMNIGMQGRGTAILTKLNLQPHGTVRLPSGRGLAIFYESTCIVNIHALSGSTNRAEREDFFNSEIIALLPHVPTDLILAGDFNCVLSNNDCTGNRSCSRALDRLVHGLHLTDAWDVNIHPQAYTHYTPAGAARLDRFYINKYLLNNKQGVETIAAAITDHLAVLLRIKLSTPVIHRGRNSWRMNTSFLNEMSFRAKIRDALEVWKRT